MFRSFALSGLVRGQRSGNLRLGCIREPRGRVIAKVHQEGPVRVLVRRVGARHRCRARDAWPLGAHALKQALDLGVDLLRYVVPEGTHEIHLAEFVIRSERVTFPNHETQHMLARSRYWRFTPHAPATVEQLALEIGA